MMLQTKINVLGTEYTLEESNLQADGYLDGRDGYCDTSIKKCVVDEMKPTGDLGQKKNLEEYKNSVKRHEIIHAFLFESGLEACCGWAGNEEMVDWLAIQIPKMVKTFKEAGCL